jgi:hypothetical protein
MKATLEFDLPEDDYDHKAALAGHNALMLIDELEEMIRAKINDEEGEFQNWKNEDGEEKYGDYDTLDRVWDWIIREKQERNLPHIV